MMILTKNDAKQISDNLNSREIDCKCAYDHCTRTLMDVDVVERFENLRLALGDQPLTITSGFRCSNHNYDEGGKDLSRHMMGRAIDIKCPDDIQFRRFYNACKIWFPFVLAYPKLGFCHCDVDIR